MEVIKLLVKDDIINEQILSVLGSTRVYRFLSQSTTEEEDVLSKSAILTADKKLVENFATAPVFSLDLGFSGWDMASSIRFENNDFLLPLHNRLIVSQRISHRGLKVVFWVSFLGYCITLIGVVLVWFYKMKPAFDLIENDKISLKQQSNRLLEKNQELLKLQYQYLTAQRIAQFGYWTLDSEGKVECSDGLRQILHVNSGGGPRSLQEMIELSPPEHHQKVERLYKDAHEVTQAVEITRAITLSDGTKLIVREMVAHEISAINEPGFLYGIILDITEHTQTEARLAQAQKLEAVGQLTGGIAHDLNNMLAIVTGNAELISIKNPGLDDPRIHNILNATQKGVKLIDQMLLFSGRLTLLPETVNMKDIIEDMSELLPRSLTEEIKLEYRIDDDLWSIFIDHGQMEHVLVNLILNARDAIKRDGKVVISCKNFVCDDRQAKDLGLASGDYVCLSVRDNGIGMSEAMQERIFEPFFTQKSTGKRGRGLGLSMVYGFVYASNGVLKVHSEEDRGSTFYIYLPRTHIAAHNDLEDEKLSIIKGHGEVVLVVEDQKDLMSVITDQLHRLGYQTLVASNVKLANEMIDRGEEIDLILSDIILPEGTRGVDFVSKKLAKDLDVDVVLMSGDIALCEQYAQEYGDKFQVLRKPFSLGTLSRVLRKAIYNG